MKLDDGNKQLTIHSPTGICKYSELTNENMVNKDFFSSDKQLPDRRHTKMWPFEMSTFFLGLATFYLGMATFFLELATFFLGMATFF